MDSKDGRLRNGFTLIELLIVVGVVAVLATVAVPTYQDQIRKARRTDGQSALLAIAMAQERFRANCSRYANRLDPTQSGVVCDATGDDTLPLATTSPEGWYYLALSDAKAAGFVATATALNAQAADRAGGVSCGELAIDENGAKTPEACWR
jgi:type IV pilus assembly protein PilE